ncbi:MAG: hypothetical protein DWP97_12475 [Calditrichaeota bacterium]|nr:MAG: hypothetical protein DWP97_12475 [Calditrichota bacterium]
MAAKWTEIEDSKHDLLDILKMLSEGKSFAEIQKVEPVIDGKVLQQVFERVEQYLRMHLILDELMYLQSQTFTEQEKFYRKETSQFSEDEEHEIIQLWEYDFSEAKIAKIFLRDKKEIQNLLNNIKKKGAYNG